ncbi:hypothetical protein SAMN05428975_3957 [Mucilaginibacter sp. OK268]|uniref:hypothetical protein n=1 Tax=Mucilaginibacter sp. OK268 TaxID=1881048 RepID=UPI00088CEEF0|nr:hypothetical protein [Mucilaginibacter sp. OK268]SDP94600.1 hypothetical protein SAMN05428975_3957 [Mucilaginibacter sp. OK268]
MLELSPLNKLDIVLAYIINKNDNKIFYSDVLSEFKQFPKKELTEVILKLEKDGFVLVKETTYNTQPVDCVYSTFEGRLFYNNGGYKKQMEIDELNFKTSQTSASQASTYANQILFATRLAAFVGLLILLWYIFVWLCPHPTDCFC